MALGMDLDTVIAKVTTKPAQVFDYGAQIGTLKPGTDADIGIFELQEGKFEFVDTSKGKRTGRQMLNKVAVRHGEVFVNDTRQA
jgi:dihydroorotase